MAKDNESKGMKQSTKTSILGGTAVAAGSIATGLATQLQAGSSIQSIDAAKEQLDKRGDMLLASIAQKGQRLAGRQITQYAASGVELSGSALDVVLETETQATAAQMAASMEINAKQQQLAMQKAALEVEQDYALFNSILSGATQAVGVAALSSSKTSSGKKKINAEEEAQKLKTKGMFDESKSNLRGLYA